jgi:hypothetical protein
MADRKKPQVTDPEVKAAMGRMRPHPEAKIGAAPEPTLARKVLEVLTGYPSSPDQEPSGLDVLLAGLPFAAIRGSKPLAHMTFANFRKFDPLKKNARGTGKGMFPHLINAAESRQDAEQFFGPWIYGLGPREPLPPDPTRRVLEFTLDNKNTLDLAQGGQTTISKDDLMALYSALSGQGEIAQNAVRESLALMRAGKTDEALQMLTGIISHAYPNAPFEAGFDAIRITDHVPGDADAMFNAWAIRNPALLRDARTGRSLGDAKKEITRLPADWFAGDHRPLTKVMPTFESTPSGDIVEAVRPWAKPTAQTMDDIDNPFRRTVRAEVFDVPTRHALEERLRLTLQGRGGSMLPADEVKARFGKAVQTRRKRIKR